ncbi:MAG: TrkA family potassium uptake protein [Actinobacteria bacterium]|nr:TrkA family potassium uptake protein [Actinomycetota bacterium]
MYILIAGAGKVGRYLALSLSDLHQIGSIDLRDDHLAQLEGKPNITTYKGDATDPRKLEEAGILRADVVASVTGDDEDNLVISQLAKQVYQVPRVIGRINDPRNQWLFTRKWGVDIAVSSPHIMLQLIAEEISLGEVLTLLKLKVGELSLVEITVADDSPARNREIRDLGFPANAVAVAVLRDTTVMIPHGGTVIESGDSLLFVTRPELERDIRQILAG